eukprot:635359-Ditylum_brightwellii.AAC.1
MSRHVSSMITSRADGQYSVPDKYPDYYESYGAPPPFIIHKQPTVTRKYGNEKTLDDVMKEETEIFYSAGLNVVDNKGHD